MLTIFVLPKNGNSDVKKLVESFSFVSPFIKYVPVDNVDEINGYVKQTEWFGVFYENEYIEEKLAVAIPTFIKMGDFDYLVVFKLLEDKALFFPRFFHSKIYLNDDFSPLYKGWKHEKILNGWVLEQ